MTKVFINFTNHPSDIWSERQRKAAEKYGTIINIPFPKVDPNMTAEEIKTIAKEYEDKITSHNPAAVLCQGESTLCYNVVSKLKEDRIVVLSACSERIVQETDEGKIVKFEFEQFREY